jgi:putative ABC transport system permease protein
MTDIQREGMQSIQVVMNAMLVLAVLSAGLGVVNTTVVGLTERRREFGILRAAGATRRQVRIVVVVEGLLFGFLGAGLGLVGGAGVVVIYAVVSGGSAMGFTGFPVWPAAWASVAPALRTGMVALLLTPLLTAILAWIPARRLLQGSVTEALSEGGRGW